MAKQRDKELNHEGPRALGRWNSQWSHMQPYVGWALLSASVTCLQGYVRWDPFVLRAQPLDTSPLSLGQHNKMLLPAKLPQCPVSQLEISATLKALYRILDHLNHTVHFALVILEMGVSWCTCLSWPQTLILPISASHVARITGRNHLCTAGSPLMLETASDHNPPSSASWVAGITGMVNHTQLS
jgi:hypothetical protein